MSGYLKTLDALPEQDRWAEVRRLIFSDPLPFFKELRQKRPVYVLPEVTLACSLADCALILRRPKTFGVDLYKPKQGDYFMSHDDTAKHWREKSIMKAILDVEDIPKIRAWIGSQTADVLKASGGNIELVRAITRGIPTKLVQDWFGFTNSDPDKLIEWSYWNQQDAFWNQPFDSVAPEIDQARIIKNRERANVMMAIYLGRLVLKKAAAVKLGSRSDDPVSRLLRLSFSDGLEFGVRDVIFNVGGLLIGAVETTNHAVCNALSHLAGDPKLLKSAKEASLSDDPIVFDGYVFEALRFNPAFPYFFRTCHVPTTLGAGTVHAQEIQPGATVLALTHSGMFDPQGFPEPDRFDVNRDFSDTFTFGQGIHSCLGRHIAGVMVPEIARQILRDPTIDLSGSKPDFEMTNVPQKWALSTA